MGVEEGLVGMATGAVALADVVGRLQPGRLFYDPVGWLQDWDTAVGAGWHAVSNPLETGAALLDVETLRENPTRWAGKLAPEVLLAVGTVGTAALAGRAGAAGRLRTVADDLDAAKRNGGVYPRVDPADIAARVGYLGHPPGSSAARGAAQQLQPPFGTPDRWVATTLRPGQRIAVTGDFATPADGGLPTSAREFFESVQQHPSRRHGPDGDVPQPSHEASIPVYEVHGEIDAATARALANPKFGPGGDTIVSLDIDAAIDAGKLVEVDAHHFDRNSLGSRIEDPEFKAIDETLPDRALDPDREAARAAARAGAEEVRDYPIGPAATSAVAALDEPDEPGPSGHPDHQGVR